MNKTTASFVGATALGLAATATLSLHLPVNAADEPVDGTTLVYRIAERDLEEKHIDHGKRGVSVGDRFLTAATLKADGAIAGRLQHECVVLDRTYEGHLCAMAILLDGGSLTLAAGGANKAIPNVEIPPGEAYAVTGGTGDYAGASGQLTVGDDGQTVTITLEP